MMKPIDETSLEDLLSFEAIVGYALIANAFKNLPKTKARNIEREKEVDAMNAADRYCYDTQQMNAGLSGRRRK